MNNIIQEKKELLEKRIKTLPSKSRDNILKQLKDAKNLNDLMLIEKTLNLKHNKKEENKPNKNDETKDNSNANKQDNNKNDEFDDSSGPSNLQIRFAIKRDDYLWKIRMSNLSRDQKQDLIKIIDDLDKDNSLDLLKKWELLNEMKKYITK